MKNSNLSCFLLLVGAVLMVMCFICLMDGLMSGNMVAWKLSAIGSVGIPMFLVGEHIRTKNLQKPPPQ